MNAGIKALNKHRVDRSTRTVPFVRALTPIDPSIESPVKERWRGVSVESKPRRVTAWSPRRTHDCASARCSTGTPSHESSAIEVHDRSDPALSASAPGDFRPVVPSNSHAFARELGASIRRAKRRHRIAPPSRARSPTRGLSAPRPSGVSLLPRSCFSVRRVLRKGGLDRRLARVGESQRARATVVGFLSPMYDSFLRESI